MALCDFLIEADITGYDCSNPPIKGAEGEGLLINRADIESYSGSGFERVPTLKCGGLKAYTITLGGKQPWNGTQQEMVEGANANTITNTVQFVVLKHDEEWAEQLFALANGDFVAIVPNKNGTYQIYGTETGLHASGAIRELYSDDNLAGWQVTMVEEGATMGNYFLTNASSYNTLKNTLSGPCTP